MSSVLHTKLHGPRVDRGWLDRRRIHDALDEGLSRRLVVVDAPAGFGKSTAVAAWLATRDAPSAWVSLDELDADPARFWLHVAAALGGIDGVEVDAIVDVLASADPEIDDVVAALLRELAGTSGVSGAVLVLDDVHRVSMDGLRDTLSRFVEFRPDWLAVALSTRSGVDLPLARYRGSGELVELRQADLHFTEEEVADYLTSRGIELDARLLPDVARRTEGWVASLQLLGLRLDGAAPDEQADFVRRFAGDDRYVVDYLVEEVLERLHPTWQRFLLATAFLPRMTDELARSVFAAVSPDPPPSIEAVERAGLFVIPLDTRREWYRYHHLFEDLLRVRATGVIDVPAVHAAATGWCLAAGRVVEAIDYAFAGGDDDAAIDILSERFPELIGLGELRSLRRQLGRVPEERFLAESRLSIAFVYAEVLGGDVREARAGLDRVRGHTDVQSPEAVAAHVAMLGAFLAQAEQDVDAVVAELAIAHDTFARLGLTYMVHVAEGELAGAALAEGRLEDAVRRARAAIDGGAATGNYLEVSVAGWCLSSIFSLMGRPPKAEELSREVLATLRRSVPRDGLASAYATIGLADALAHQGRLEEARALLDTAEASGRVGNFDTVVADALLTRLRVELAEERPANAALVADELVAMIDEGRVLSLIGGPARALRVRLLLAVGRTSEAVELTAGWPHTLGFEVLRLLSASRVAFATGDESRALEEARTATAAAADVGAEGWRVEALLEEVRCLYARRDPAADARLEEALGAAAPARNRLPFLLAREAVEPGLRRAVARRAEDSPAREFATALLGRFATREDEAPSLLSDRELDGVRLIEAGLTNPAIAERLFLSVGTVKRHTHNIYRKLDASGRTDAVRRARELGLLASA